MNEKLILIFFSKCIWILLLILYWHIELAVGYIHRQICIVAKVYLMGQQFNLAPFFPNLNQFCIYTDQWWMLPFSISNWFLRNCFNSISYCRQIYIYRQCCFCSKYSKVPELLAFAFIHLSAFALWLFSYLVKIEFSHIFPTSAILLRF